MMLTFLRFNPQLHRGEKEGQVALSQTWLKSGYKKLLSTRAWILGCFLVCISERHVIEIIKSLF